MTSQLAPKTRPFFLFFSLLGGGDRRSRRLRYTFNYRKQEGEARGDSRAKHRQTWSSSISKKKKKTGKKKKKKKRRERN